MDQNQTESGKKKTAKRVLKIVFLLAIGGLILFWLLVPSIAESVLVNALRGMGLQNPRLTIRHVGLHQVIVQDLTLGNPEEPDLIIPSLAADFSLLDLIKGRVKKIEIAGMKLYVTAGKGGLTVKGIEPLKKSKKGGKSALPVRRIHIASSIVNLDWEGRKVIVPLDLQASADDPGETVVFSAALNPHGDAIAIEGTLDVSSGDGAFKLSATDADASQYLHDFNVPLLQWFKSRVQCNADINVNAWRITANRVSLVTQAFSTGFPGRTVNGALQLDCRLNREMNPEDIKLKLRFAAVEQEDFQIEIPFDLDMAGSQLNALTFRLGDLKLEQPPGIALRNFYGTASIESDRLQIQGSFECGTDAAFFKWLFPAAQMKGELAITGTVQIATTDRGTDWSLKGKGRGRVALAQEDTQAKAESLAFSFASSGKEGSQRNDLDLEFKGVEVKARDFAFFARAIRCQGTVDGAVGKNWSAGGRLKVSDATVRQAGGLAIEGLVVDAPWRYPAAAKIDGKGNALNQANPGTWRSASLKVGDLNLGEIAGEVVQKERGVEFFGVAQTPVEPLKIKLAGTCQWRDDGINARLQFEAPETQIAKDSSLKELHPGLAEFRCSGYLSAQGTISALPGELSSQAKIKIRDWEMASESGGINSQGMNMTLDFEDLLNLHSQPSQRLDFEQLNVSGVQLKQGNLRFKIDGTDSLYIEGGEFGFSSGKILLLPLHYDFKGKESKITLYSDRINFAEMLNTLLGEKIAAGDAELNGLLTIDLVEGLPVFRNGYLYSTPGVGGNIKFERSEAISGGQVIVEEAVKDFNYDWIKVKLDTAKENLNLIAFINGVPAQKLPLTYDTRHKDIIRDPTGRRNLELKGLLLELRFTDIDLKRLMKGGAKVHLQEKKDSPKK